MKKIIKNKYIILIFNCLDECGFYIYSSAIEFNRSYSNLQNKTFLSKMFYFVFHLPILMTYLLIGYTINNYITLYYKLSVYNIRIVYR